MLPADLFTNLLQAVWPSSISMWLMTAASRATVGLLAPFNTVLVPVQAHIWDSNSSTKGTPVSSSKSGKGKQLHLGSFPTAVHAARAYDRAALLLRGPTAALNFPVEEYHRDPLLEVSLAA